MSLYSDTTYTVCGICEPFSHFTRRQGRGRGTAFTFNDTNFSGYVAHCYVKCHEGQREEVREWIEDIRSEMLPANVSPEIKTLAQDIKDHQPMGNLLIKIILSFSAVSLILTLIRPSYTIFFSFGPLFWIAIFAIVAALTFVTIIFRILRIAKENPAEVLKRE